MQIEACKVRKGMLILIEGEQGPRLVTKREKWNSTHYRIYYAPASNMMAGRLTNQSISTACHSFVYLRYDALVELLQ